MRWGTDNIYGRREMDKRKLPPYFCAVSPWLGRLRGIVQLRTMSAFGTKRTWQRRSAMSAFGGKADPPTSRNVQRYTYFTGLQ